MQEISKVQEKLIQVQEKQIQIGVGRETLNKNLEQGLDELEKKKKIFAEQQQLIKSGNQAINSAVTSFGDKITHDNEQLLVGYKKQAEEEKENRNVMRNKHEKCEQVSSAMAEETEQEGLKTCSEMEAECTKRSGQVSEQVEKMKQLTSVSLLRKNLAF